MCALLMTNHHSDRCWQKFGKHDWVANSASTDASSSSSLSMMTISREDYDCLMKLQGTPTTPPAHSSHHASTSDSSIALPLRSTLGLLTWGHLPIC